MRHCFCGVKSISIIEELGNINFIFSDKTGTLTKNELEFRYCIIENKVYEYSKSYGVGYKNEILNTKIKESNNSFSNLLENNNKNDLIGKFNIDNINEENLEPIEDIEDDIYIDKNDDLKKSNKSNKNESENEVPELDFCKQRSRSSNKIKNYNFKTKHNNDDNCNNSNNTNGSHSSHKNSNKSPNFSNFYNQINNYKQIKNELNRNSTILEIKNDEYLNSFTNTTKKDIITFGEGYFMNYNYNEYLKNIENNEEQSLNYIHEFWKALAITNE
jgi:magnesium-transporting ATPase (P-type)